MQNHSNTICQCCGKHFYIRPSHLLRGKSVHCSKACFGQSKKGIKPPQLPACNIPRIELICKQCGSPFSVKRSKATKGTAKYCSRECCNAGRQIPVVERFWAKVDKRNDNECWLWQARLDKDGYGRISITHNKHMPAHRFSYQLHFGPIVNDLLVCHSCDNPTCVNPNHLWVGTNRDNIIDRGIKGRTANGNNAAYGKHPESYKHLLGDGHWTKRANANIPRGELRPQAKLTSEQVRAIRREYIAHKTTLQELATQYGVSFGQIGRIIQRKSWRQVS